MTSDFIIGEKTIIFFIKIALSDTVFYHLPLSIFVLLAKEIIGGMLDLEPRLWRKGVRQNFEEQRKKVLQFAQWWKPYDFTKKKE